MPLARSASAPVSDSDSPPAGRRTASGGELSPSVPGSEDDEPLTGPQNQESNGATKLRRSSSEGSLSSVDDDQRPEGVIKDSEEVESAFDYSDTEQLKRDIGALRDFFSTASSIGKTKASTWLDAQYQKLQCNPFLRCSDLASEETNLVQAIGQVKYDRLVKLRKEARERMVDLKLTDWLTKVPVVE
jgi:hypothetical protein